jgi:hypothetical protein
MNTRGCLTRCAAFRRVAGQGSQWRRAVLCAGLGVSSPPAFGREVLSQSLSTASIRGTVSTTEVGRGAEGATVRVQNTSTGYSVTVAVISGRFLVNGLAVGGPYIVSVRQPGHVPYQSGPLLLALGDMLELRVLLHPLAVPLAGIAVTATDARVTSAPVGGASTIRASLLHRLPSLNRNYVDFVALAPFVSTKVGLQRQGMSAAGANFRFNNYLVNGADEHFVNSNVSLAHAGGKSIPLEAVKEYQVLIAPYSVRYGDFAGALVNTVTESGTNSLRGSAFAYWRNDHLARGGELASPQPYDRLQYGFVLGGPIVRDRVHFFIAPEIQRLTSPAPGPFVGQSPAATPALPVKEDDVDRFARILGAYRLTPGSGGAVETGNPLWNLFARVDATVPRWNSRAMIMVNEGRTDQSTFSRAATDSFYFSSLKQTSATRMRLASLQLHTDFIRVPGAHNEFLITGLSDRVEQVPSVRQPLVRVLVPGTGGIGVTMAAGAAEQAQGAVRFGRSLKIKNDLTLPLGDHHVVAGGMQLERFTLEREGVAGGYGAWSFPSLDAFESGAADRYELRRDPAGANRPLRGTQYAAWAGDEWRATPSLSLTFGLRAEALAFHSRAPYSAVVDSLFRRRTDAMPNARVYYSPRAGFTWDPAGGRSQRIRGGVGVFTGRPPLAWLHPVVVNYGIGIELLRCGFAPTDQGPPPAFEPDYRNAPLACATGGGVQTVGDVDLVDPDLRPAQALRTSLAYERELPGGLASTTEVMFARYLSDFVFVNLNLVGPQAVDQDGRVMYGTIASNGIPVVAQRSSFPEVIDLRNTSRNSSQQFSTRLEKRIEPGTQASISYTYTRTRDVQSPTRVNLTGISIWADARPVSGRHDAMTPGISLNDIPHRVIGLLSYTAPWTRWSTDVSLLYRGESGSPFTYRAGGAGRRGDLNADGSNVNDPIYVPRDVADTNEIRFSGRSDANGADNSAAAQAQRVMEQQKAFGEFIRQSRCLRRQRGRILERNSCREPWSHMTVASVRQRIPVGARTLEVQADLFNVLNLLHTNLGRVHIATPRLLEHVGQTTGPSTTTQPIFRFDLSRSEWTTLQNESAFQIQVALRYRF